MRSRGFVHTKHWVKIKTKPKKNPLFTGINSLAISISSSLSVKSLCKSMQLAIEPFLFHC